MLPSIASLLIPLALAAGLHTASPATSENVQAFVTGYNTVKKQTSSHPCIAASGANICGRYDAVACPRRISLGTLVEINGATYVCEDRLAKKYDDRFDISCDKDMACPYQVAGWTTVKVFDDTTRAEPLPAVATQTADATAPAPKPPVKLARAARSHGAARVKIAKKEAPIHVASAALRHRA